MENVKEIMMEMLPLLVKLAVLVVFVLCSKYIVPWLKEQRIYATVEKFVRAAEKLAAAGKLPKESKNEYVCRMLEAAGIKVTPVVKAMIEAAVEALDIAKQEYPLLGIPEEETDEQEDETPEKAESEIQ